MSLYWNILGLDSPTADVKLIKRAYSKRLKQTRPEDDPEGFMALRQAYDAAVRQAKFLASQQDKPAQNENHVVKVPPIAQPSSIIKDLSPQSPIELASTSEEKESRLQAVEEEKAQQYLSDLLQDLDNLLSTQEKYTDGAAWRELLQKRSSLDIEAFGQFENYVISKLLGYHKFQRHERITPKGEQKPYVELPKNIIPLIYAEMNWDDNLSRPYKIQKDLLWLGYETEFYKRPAEVEKAKRKAEEDAKIKKEKRRTWTHRFLILGAIFSLAIGSLIGKHLTKPIINNDNITPIDEPVKTVYGRYSRTSDTEYKYTLLSSPEVSALEGSQTLSDFFEIKWNGRLSEHVVVIIQSKDHDPRVRFEPRAIRPTKTERDIWHERFDTGLFISGFILVLYLYLVFLNVIISFIVSIFGRLFRRER